MRNIKDTKFFKWLSKLFVGEWVGGDIVPGEYGLGELTPAHFQKRWTFIAWEVCAGLFDGIRVGFVKFLALLVVLSTIIQGVPAFVDSVPKLVNNFLTAVHAYRNPQADCENPANSRVKSAG